MSESLVIPLHHRTEMSCHLTVPSNWSSSFTYLWFIPWKAFEWQDVRSCTTYSVCMQTFSEFHVGSLQRKGVPSLWTSNWVWEECIPLKELLGKSYEPCFSSLHGIIQLTKWTKMLQNKREERNLSWIACPWLAKPDASLSPPETPLLCLLLSPPSLAASSFKHCLGEKRVVWREGRLSGWQGRE